MAFGAMQNVCSKSALFTIMNETARQSKASAMLDEFGV